MNTLLFDTSPIDEPERKKARKKAAAVQAPPQPEEPRPPLPPAQAEKILGTIPDAFDCWGGCGGRCHDILSERWTTITVEEGDSYVEQEVPVWRLQCCYCFTIHTEHGIVGFLKPSRKSDEFRLPDGRSEYVGLTWDEIEAAGGGWYIEYCAGKHKLPSVRDAAQKRIDAHKAAR